MFRSQCGRDHLISPRQQEEAPMGLLDILNGMQNGPRGQTDPNAKGGMSPITMAILALIAYKGLKSFGGGQQAPSSAPQQPQSGGGGLGDVLGGLLGGRGGFGNALGGMLAGGAAGCVLSGGLGSLLEQFQKNGQG